MTVDDIITAARECIDTPFRHQGRICGVALDCAGVVCHVADRIGVSYSAPVNYARVPHNGLLKKTLDDQPALIKVSNRQPGDILLMRFARDPQHVAIFTGTGIIHAFENVGKCCEHDLDDRWIAKIVASYRFRGIA